MTCGHVWKKCIYMDPRYLLEFLLDFSTIKNMPFRTFCVELRVYLAVYNCL